MLQLYVLRDDRLIPVEPGVEPPETVAWADLVHPTKDEEERVERFLGIDIPTREEMAEIEVSSRLFRENDSLFMTANLLVGGDGPAPAAHPVSFILTRHRLVTVRYSEPGSFRIFAKQAQKADSDLKSAEGLFLTLIETIVDRTADILEKVAADTDAISRDVFKSEASEPAKAWDYKAVLRQIGRSGDLNSKVRESLVSIGRLTNFISAECGELGPGLRERTDTIAADIRSLADHSSYVAGTTVFLLDATLGLINIEQNNIIKIVSVVSVVIMPPTLIASIYGMNFDVMPELHWRIGYPLALASMLVAAVLPYWYFRRRGWL